MRAVPLLLGGALTACSRGDPEEAQPYTVEVDTTASGSLSLQPLLATLSIPADLPPPTAFPGDSVPLLGWLFVDGQLVDRLPAHTKLQVAAGSYEVRAVVAREAGTAVSLWTASVQVEAGTGDTVSVPMGEALREWLVLGVQRAGIVYAHVEPAPSVYDVVLPDEAGMVRLNELRTLLPERWNRFVRSPEWTLVDSVGRLLDAAPPTRPRVWVDLPDSLGGPREVDPEQLEVLAVWYRAALRDGFSLYVPDIALYDELGLPVFQTDQFRALYDVNQQFVDECRDWVDTVLARIRDAVARAPKEDG